MDISPREARYQRLIQTRNKYSITARKKAEQFRQQMAVSKENMLFEKQQQDMVDIERELEVARRQYQKVCQERGTAHLAAKLIQRQEQEMIDFESRRDKLVRVRAEKVAKKTEQELRGKIKETESKKKEMVEKRKEIFNHDWYGEAIGTSTSKSVGQTSVKRNDDKATKRKEIESQLAKLREMEKSLEDKIKNKKNERNNQQIKENVPEYELSSDSSVDSVEYTDPHFVGRYIRHGPVHTHEHHGHNHHGHHHHHDHQTKPKTLSSKSSGKKSDSGFLENDPMTDPELIAKNVLLKLERMKDQMRKTIEAAVVSNTKRTCDKTQYYKDTAINTSKPKSVAQETSVVEELPSGTSSSSSYRSLPKDIQPKKREFAHLIEKLKELAHQSHVDGGDVNNSTGLDSRQCDQLTGIEKYKKDHNDRLNFWNEVCQEAGTMLHEETVAALLANMSDGSKEAMSYNVSKFVDGGNDEDSDSDTGSIVVHEVSSEEEFTDQDRDGQGQSTPKPLPSSPSTTNTLKGITEERSLTFASSFESDE